MLGTVGISTILKHVVGKFAHSIEVLAVFVAGLGGCRGTAHKDKPQDEIEDQMYSMLCSHAAPAS